MMRLEKGGDYPPLTLSMQKISESKSTCNPNLLNSIGYVIFYLDSTGKLMKLIQIKH